MKEGMWKLYPNLQLIFTKHDMHTSLTGVISTCYIKMMFSQNENEIKKEKKRKRVDK